VEAFRCLKGIGSILTESPKYVAGGPQVRIALALRERCSTRSLVSECFDNNLGLSATDASHSCRVTTEVFKESHRTVEGKLPIFSVE
jgi:hypothetical protein